jgi:predicted negative regulator of RcsB-dependent stress response
MSSEATQTLTIYDLLAWLETNKKTLILGFVVAVVVGFGIAAYRYSAHQKEVAANDALLKLKTALSGADIAPAPDAAAYLKVAEQFAGTSAAERALLLAGTSLFSESKYAEAQAQFGRFLRDHAQSPFAVTAAYGTAAALEAQGKRDEALAAYQNLSVRYPNSSVLDDAKLAIARIYESKNQPEQAYRLYEELVKGGIMGSAASEAMSRKADLAAKHPEFVKTNAPVAAASAVVTAPSTNPPAITLSNSAPATR